MPEFTSAEYGNPNRGTSEQQLDQWNQQFRQSPIYQNFMRRHGLPTDGRVQLSRNQQGALEAELRTAGFQIPSGMHIDQGGNLNQKNRLVRNIGIGAGIGGAALTGLGLAGMGPLSGLGGGGGLASASVPGAVGAEAAPLGAGSVVAGGALPSGLGAAGAGAGAVGSAAAGTGGAAAGGAAKSLLGLTAKDWAALALTGAGTIGAATQDRPTMAPNTMTTDPNLAKLLQSMQGRLDQSEPLYKSIMAMANGLLPTQYQNGGAGR